MIHLYKYVYWYSIICYRSERVNALQQHYVIIPAFTIDGIGGYVVTIEAQYQAKWLPIGKNSLMYSYYCIKEFFPGFNSYSFFAAIEYIEEPDIKR